MNSLEASNTKRQAIFCI